MISNVNVFTQYESLLPNGIKIIPTIYQNKTKFLEKLASSGFNYKEVRCINCVQAI